MTPAQAKEDRETFRRCGICCVLLAACGGEDYDSVNYCGDCGDGRMCIPVPYTEWIGKDDPEIRLCNPDQPWSRPYIGRGW